MAGTYLKAMTDITREHGFEPLRVEGRVPDELVGTMYRNGPGLFSNHGHRYRHWFDGDGLVSAVRFAGGQAFGAARLVQTRGLLEERARGRAYFLTYGTRPPGGWNPWRVLRFVREGGKNSANTSMFVWHNRVFALCEVGRPYEIDPRTLETFGEEDFGVVFRPFSAHPHRVDETGYVYNFGLRVGPRTALDLYALRPDGSVGKVVQIPLPRPTLIHDFAVTARHAVFFCAPLEISLLRVLLERSSYADAMTWRPELGTEVIVVPLDAPASPIRFTVDAFWAWHVANAFERGGEIVVDVVRHRDFRRSAAWLSGMLAAEPVGDAEGRLHRLRVDPTRQRMQAEPLRDRTGEFPRIAPSEEGRDYEVLYHSEHSSPEAGRRGPPDTLVRIELATGAVDEHRFAAHETPSEGVFVPRPGGRGPRDGWVVSLVYDARAHASAWVVLDAARLNDGPVARAWFDHHVPLTLHGAWLPAQ